MASDDLLSALTGVLEGVASVYIPFQQELQKSRIRQNEAEGQFQRDIRLKQATVPIENQQEVFKSNLDLQKQKNFESFKSPIEMQRQIAVEQSKPQKQYQPYDPQGKPIGKPTFVQPVNIGKPEKSTVNANAKNQKDIALLKSTRASFQKLMDDFHKAKGSSGAVGGAMKLGASLLSRGKFDPSAKVYHDRAKEFIQTANRQMTGSARSTQLALQSALGSIPEFFEDGTVSQSKEQQFHSILDDRIKELGGGEVSDEPSNLTPDEEEEFNRLDSIYGGEEK